MVRSEEVPTSSVRISEVILSQRAHATIRVAHDRLGGEADEEPMVDNPGERLALRTHRSGGGEDGKAAVQHVVAAVRDERLGRRITPGESGHMGPESLACGR